MPDVAEGDELHQRAVAHSYVQGPAYYRLGESGLPVAPFREHFLATSRDHQALVVSSETGSGKSSQLPLYLLEAGYPRIWVTQPRIIAARELLERARQNLGDEYAHLAGYLTGKASDSDCAEGARLIYITDGLLLNLANHGQLSRHDVVMVDEAHELTKDTVGVLGLMQDIRRANPDIREIISSATIDTGMFAQYLETPTGKPAPVLTLPGRTFPVEWRETTDSVGTAMRRHMREGRKVLGFEPGVSRIRHTAAKAQSRRSGDTVHMLYGDQSPAVQKQALTPEPQHHVVSSRIGETSITPLGMEAVVDSGLSNYGGYRAGVRIIRTDFSSIAEMGQRAGRVGRVAPGIYELAVPDDAPPPPAMADRPLYPPSAIENSSVASLIAQLAAGGRRLEDLHLIKRPTEENLAYDKLLLRRLGAMVLDTDGELQLTDIGHAMTGLSLPPPLARMLIEARRPVEDASVDVDALRLQVAAAAAVQQVNGIFDATQGSMRRYLHRKGHQEMLSSENTSDVLFALDVFASLYAKQRQLMGSGAADAAAQFDRLLVTTDILPNRYYKAVETYIELCRREEIKPEELRKPAAANRKRIVACQITGAEELFVQRSKQVHWDIRGERRTLGRRTTVAPSLARLVIGTAFDLEGLSKRGRYNRKFIAGGTVVTPEELVRHIPERITRRNLGYAVSKRGDMLVQREALYFDGELLFAERAAEMPPTEQTRRTLIMAMMMGVAPSLRDPEQPMAFRPANCPNAAGAVRQWKLAQALEQRSPVKLNTEKGYAKLIKKIFDRSVDPKSPDYIPLDVTDPAQLDHLIPQIYRNALVRPTRKRHVPTILQQSPDAVKVAGEEGSQYVAITYKNNVAHITVPPELKFAIRPEHFAGLQAHHDVKIRIGRGGYHRLEAAFELLDEQREVAEQKQARRQALREYQEAARARRDDEPTRRERRDQEEREIEAKIRALMKRPKNTQAARKRRRLLQQLRLVEQS